MMRTEEEVRARLRDYFRQTLRFRRYRDAALTAGNRDQAHYDGQLALAYWLGFRDLYWVLHPGKEHW